MTHTIRFEHVEGRGPSTGIAYRQETLEARTRLDNRAILRELHAKGYRGVLLCSITTAPTDAHEVQRDLDRLLERRVTQ